MVLRECRDPLLVRLGSDMVRTGGGVLAKGQAMPLCSATTEAYTVRSNGIPVVHLLH